MGYLPACMFIHYVCNAPRGQNDVLDFSGNGITSSWEVPWSAGTQTLIKCFYPLSHLTSPHLVFLAHVDLWTMIHAITSKTLGSLACTSEPTDINHYYSVSTPGLVKETDTLSQHMVQWAKHTAPNLTILFLSRILMVEAESQLLQVVLYPLSWNIHMCTHVLTSTHTHTHTV